MEILRIRVMLNASVFYQMQMDKSFLGYRVLSLIFTALDSNQPVFVNEAKKGSLILQ